MMPPRLTCAACLTSCRWVWCRGHVTYNCDGALILFVSMRWLERPASHAAIHAISAQVVPEFVVKIIQVFDCKVARHGNMIVGKTGSGKSEAWKALTRAMARLRKEEPDDERYQKVGSLVSLNCVAQYGLLHFRA